MIDAAAEVQEPEIEPLNSYHIEKTLNVVRKYLFSVEMWSDMIEDLVSWSFILERE